jgi:hypothetical protein
MFLFVPVAWPADRCPEDSCGLDQGFSMTYSPRKGVNWGGRIVAATVAAAVATAALLFALAGPANASASATGAPVYLVPNVSLL